MQRLILATAVTMLLAPISLAQTSITTGSGAGASTAAPAPTGPDLTRASRVLRQNVYNPNGDAVGSIDELIIDPHSGQIQQVVIGVGGFLGIGEKRVAVPFNQLTVKPVAVRVAGHRRVRRWHRCPAGRHRPGAGQHGHSPGRNLAGRSDADGRAFRHRHDEGPTEGCARVPLSRTPLTARGRSAARRCPKSTLRL